MSTGGLPVAAQKVGDNVPTGAVTSPVNPKLQAADVDRKMRFYGVIEAFRKGSMPSNKQIDETLDWLIKDGSPIDESKLSSEGRTLVNDVRAIIRTAHKMVMNKNADELAQNFIWHTRKADASRAGGLATPVSKGEAQEHADQGLEHLRTLGRLVFTNSEARKILKDLSYLGRDVLADGAAKAADSARPSEAQLSQIDETAGDARWVAQDGSERGPNEPVPTSGVGAKVDQASDAVKKAQQARDDAKAAATDAAKTGAQSRDPNASVGDQLRQAGSAAADQGQRNVPADAQNQAGDAQATAQKHADDAKERLAVAIGNAEGPHSADDVRRGNVDIPNGLSDAEKEAAKQSAKDKILSVVPEKHRERVNEQVDKAKDYIKEKVPEERRDQFIYRLKKVIVEQQSHRDYQEAVEFFFNMAEQYKGHAKNAADQGAGNVQAVRSDPAVAQAELELRTLLERFANNKSMQPILDAVNQIYVDAQNDEELKRWFKRADSYLRRVLQEPGYVMKDECDREGRALRDDGQSFFSEKYRGHREDLFNSIKDFTLAFGDDPLNKQFGDDWKKLTKDLLLDGDGNLKYKQHLWQDLRSVILPTFIEKAGYIPIPRIEYTDNQLDLVIENLTLSTTNLLPNIFEVEARNYFKLSPFANISNRNRHSVWIQFSQIQADIRDVAFYVKKKSGFPKIHDEGLADVLIGGNGITGKIHLETSSSKHDVFDVKEVKVKIDELKFKIRDSRHSFLVGLVRPLANNLIKKAITQAAQQGIKDGLRELNTILSDIKARAEAAAKSDNPDETRLTGLKDALADRKKEAEAKKAEVERTADKRNSQFAIVLDPSEKINSWESRGSLIGKQGAIQEAAGKGAEWRSPAFDVVGKPIDPAARSNADTKPSHGSAGPITASK